MTGLGDTPEPPTNPPPEPPGDPLGWTDWCSDAYVCVAARTSDEAGSLTAALLARLNEQIHGEHAAIQLVDPDRLPERA